MKNHVITCALVLSALATAACSGPNSDEGAASSGESVRLSKAEGFNNDGWSAAFPSAPGFGYYSISVQPGTSVEFANSGSHNQFVEVVGTSFNELVSRHSRKSFRFGAVGVYQVVLTDTSPTSNFDTGATFTVIVEPTTAP